MTAGGNQMSNHNNNNSNNSASLARWSGLETEGMKDARCSLLLQEEVPYDARIKVLPKQRVLVCQDKGFSPPGSTSVEDNFYVDFKGTTILQLEPGLVGQHKTMPVTLTVGGRCTFTAENYQDFRVMMRTKEQSMEMDISPNGNFDWPDVSSLLLCPCCGRTSPVPQPGSRKRYEYWMVFYPLLQITLLKGSQMTLGTRTICRFTCLDCMEDLLEGLTLRIQPGGSSSSPPPPPPAPAPPSNNNNNLNNNGSNGNTATDDGGNSSANNSNHSQNPELSPSSQQQQQQSSQQQQQQQSPQSQQAQAAHDRSKTRLAFTLPAADVLAEAGSASFLEDAPPRPETHPMVDDILDAWTLYNLWEHTGAWEALQNDYRLVLSRSMHPDHGSGSGGSGHGGSGHGGGPNGGDGLTCLPVTQQQEPRLKDRIGKPCGNPACGKVHGTTDEDGDIVRLAIKCRECLSEYYCSRACREAHRDPHRVDCMRKQREREERREKKAKRVQCDTCGKKFPYTKMKKCSRCRKATYCSVECQKADWEKHRSSCKKAM